MSDINSKTVAQLKKELTALGLPTNGLKADLVQRLRENQKRKRGDDDEDEAKSDESDSDEKPKKRGRSAGKKGAKKAAPAKKTKKEKEEEEEEDEEEEEEKKEPTAKKAKKEEKAESEEEEEEEEKGKARGKGKEKEKEKKDTKEATEKANTSSANNGAWNWKGTLMYWQTEDLKGSEKIACFDYDGCLAKTSLFKKGPDAWDILFPSIPGKLKELHEKGYKLVIMTNQSDIGRSASAESRAKMIAEKVGRLTGFVNAVKLPFQVLVATAKNKTADEYRKPAIGMWTFLNENKAQNNDGIVPDKSKCFFVGDAAGRKKDHGDTHKGFAEAAGLTFFTEDEFFQKNAKY